MAAVQVCAGREAELWRGPGQGLVGRCVGGNGWRVCANSFPLEACLGCTNISLPDPCAFTVTISSQLFMVAYTKVLVLYAKHFFNFSSVF